MATQRSWRLIPTPSRIPRAGRVSRRLRVVGAALDVLGAGSYTVILRPEGVHRQGPGGYERTFDPSPLRRRAVLARHLRGQLPVK